MACKNCARLRKALRFYSREAPYRLSGAYINPDDGSKGDALLQTWELIEDGGYIARKALAGREPAAEVT